MIRVASYNIRKSVGLDRRRNPDRILEVIAQLDAEVLALQEVDQRLGRRASSLPAELMRQATGYRAVDHSIRPHSMGWHGNVILVRGKTTVVDYKRLDLPGFEPRGAVLADLEVKGEALRVVGVHLGLLARHRARQVHAIVHALERDGHAGPTIIMGDFNEWRPDGKTLRGFARSFDLHAPGPSFHTRRPVAALDRMAISRDLEVMAKGVHSSAEARRASDHLPIWADIAHGARPDWAKTWKHPQGAPAG